MGASFAQIEARVVLARLLQTFTLVPEKQRVYAHMGATLGPHPGVWMRLQRRVTVIMNFPRLVLWSGRQPVTLALLLVGLWLLCMIFVPIANWVWGAAALRSLIVLSVVLHTGGIGGGRGRLGVALYAYRGFYRGNYYFWGGICGVSYRLAFWRLYVYGIIVAGKSAMSLC